MSAYNLFQSREIVLTRLNMDGSPLANPTDSDVLYMNFPQTISFGTDKTDPEEIVNNGPEGPICTVKKQGKLKGSHMGLQLAKVMPKLRYIVEGGSYDPATDKHTAPFSTDAAPPPFKVEAYIEKYTDGNHLHGDLDGYVKILMPKCVGTIEDMSGDGSSFINPNVNFTGEEYIDELAPQNSVPCYDFDDVATLPGDAEYDAVVSVEASDAPVSGATVTIAGETPVTTDAGGKAEFSLKPGVYSVSVAKSGYTTATGVLTVGLLGGLLEITLVNS